MIFLPPSGRRLAGAERRLSLSQGILNRFRGRIRAAEDAPRDSSCVLERRHGLAESPIVRQLNASLSFYDSTNPVLNADDRLAAAKQWLRGYLWNRSNTVLILDNRILDRLAYRAEVGNYKNRSRREQVSL